jgi:Bacterial PH domain
LITAITAFLLGSMALIAPSALAPRPIANILIIPAIILTAFLVVRSFRIALRVDESAVTVLNYWRTYTLRWEEIRRIGMKAASGVWASGPSPVIVFLLADSSRVEAHATRWIGADETKQHLVGLLSSFAARKGIEIEVHPGRLH